VPYRDLRQSPPKTLGRPIRTVKKCAYGLAYHLRHEIPEQSSGVRNWSFQFHRQARGGGSATLGRVRCALPGPGQSPLKTLGRRTGRVNVFCVPFGVPSATESGGDTVRGCGNDTPDLGDWPRSRAHRSCTPGLSVSTTAFARIAASGEYGPMRGVIGRVRLLSPRSARRSTPGGAGGLLQLSLRDQGVRLRRRVSCGRTRLPTRESSGIEAAL
jgi:hypothetical protein